VQHIHFNQFGQVSGSEEQVMMEGHLYRLDGYIADTRTAIEFHGDYWHGNPRKYDQNAIFHEPKTFGDQYQKTVKKMQRLLKSGIKVFYVWEDQFVSYEKSPQSNLPVFEFLQGQTDCLGQ